MSYLVFLQKNSGCELPWSMATVLYGSLGADDSAHIFLAGN